jgi:hypothetical protein
MIIEDDPRGRRFASRLPVLPESTLDGVDHSDHVVDDDAEGDHEPREDQRVERLSPQMEDEHRHQHRKRDRRRADQGGPPVEE